eukprot:327400_1
MVEFIIKSLEQNNFAFPPLSKDTNQQKMAFLTICKKSLMLYHTAICKNHIDITEQHFVNITNEIDLFDKETSQQLSYYLFKKILQDIERIKPWSCKHCWFKNRKMMIGGYFRYYNQLQWCGLCGKLRKVERKHKELLEEKELNKNNANNDYHISRPSNKLSLPYIANNWTMINDIKCSFKRNDVYIQSCDVEQMVILIKLVIKTLNVEILIQNQNAIVAFVKDEQIDGRAFIASNKKEFSESISKKLQNQKLVSKLYKLYLEIMKMNINCNAMKRVGMI